MLRSCRELVAVGGSDGMVRGFSTYVDFVMDVEARGAMDAAGTLGCTDGYKEAVLAILSDSAVHRDLAGVTESVALGVDQAAHIPVVSVAAQRSWYRRPGYLWSRHLYCSGKESLGQAPDQAFWQKRRTRRTRLKRRTIRYPPGYTGGSSHHPP